MKRIKMFLMGLLISVLSIGSVLAQRLPLTIEVNPMERLVIMSLLPTEGSYITLKVLNDLRAEIGFDDEELVALDFQPTPEGGLTANWTDVDVKSITFGEVTEKILYDALADLDEQETLLPDHYTLYEKIVLKE